MVFVVVVVFNFPIRFAENFPFPVNIDITFAGVISQKLWRKAHANIAFWLKYFHDCQARFNTLTHPLIIIDFFNRKLYKLLRHWGSLHHNRLLTEYWNDFLFIIPQGVQSQYFIEYQRRTCNLRLRYLFRKLRCWLLSCFLKLFVFFFFFFSTWASQFLIGFWMSHFVIERGTFSVQVVVWRWIRNRSKLCSERMVIMLTSLS